MSIADISNVVLLLSNPAWYGHGSAQSTIVQNITATSGRLSYSSHIPHQHVTTLAAEYISSSRAIQGLLYVPDLGLDDPCRNIVQPYLPALAARRADLPPASINLIGLAPWVTPQCTQSFLASARKDPIRAFVFYRPGPNNTLTPPPASSPAWDLGDNGAWRVDNRFPIVAVPGSVGAEMMTQLSLYSGNMTTVPNGEIISQLYDPREEDYLRIWTRVNVTVDRKLNSMWILIPVVLGLLMGTFIGASLIVHLVQRRRRASLRRRVQNGEVNLESLGISRLTVPMHHIHGFPLFTYSFRPEPSLELPATPDRAKLDRIAPASLMTTMSDEKSSSGRSARTKGHLSGLDYQPKCYICFDEYVDRQTVIRELPCGHIFHPKCIDELLSQSSSLCPLCKASMLPRGYSPRITNQMVRREMSIRRLRGSIGSGAADGACASSERGAKRSRLLGWASSVLERLAPQRSAAAPAISASAPAPAPALLPSVVVPAPPRQAPSPATADPESIARSEHLPPNNEPPTQVASGTAIDGPRQETASPLLEQEMNRHPSPARGNGLHT
ncbi:hypothetical protein MAPG_07036 [Magnaporthiopsis poae ATCC 64411]|uniref:RING-type domain-containing protein n=1 Tax=Magnaporthiopsis poae (strain ATCC 64411 / 73-15) TaxID=644358 RepID=A0A0C4E3M6_MAGP6|nr:hypothetical protein MAPG_07036 [Magnaporthiopsis poae ATCC 64411]